MLKCDKCKAKTTDELSFRDRDELANIWAKANDEVNHGEEYVTRELFQRAANRYVTMAAKAGYSEELVQSDIDRMYEALAPHFRKPYWNKQAEVD